MLRVPESGAMNDPKEIESYDILSKKHLRTVEKLFIKRACTLLNKTKHDKKLILDVGTGPANIPIKFIQYLPDSDILALDTSIKMLKTAKSKIAKAGLEKKINLICADAEQLPFKEETFNFAYCHSTLHHLENPHPAIQEIIRVLKKNSRFLIRDLRRPPFMLLELYVKVFGYSYTNCMKKMYRESLQAGFTFTEMKRLCKYITSSICKARRFFITHVGIEGIKKG